MGFAEVYHRYNVEFADPRTNDLWLVSSPISLAMILFGYFYFVLVCGPRYMENRKPYTLKTFIMYYNIFQIISNAWIIRKVVTGGWLTHLTFGCEPIDYSLDPMAVQLAEATWSTLMLKLIDLSETAIFVLRKKDKQISFLHLYHHASTLSFAWLMTKYFAGGMCTFHILVNNTVHVIMYTYYLFSAGGPRARALTSLVKPYITTIQIVQFFALMIHGSQGLSSSCNILTSGVAIYLINVVINSILFFHFYRQNYTKAGKKIV